MRDEGGRIVSPNDFISAAERYGITPAIDRWVIENAFRWLVSEELFVQIIQALAAGAADQIEVLRKQIEDRYRSYRADPTEVVREYGRVLGSK